MFFFYVFKIKLNIKKHVLILFFILIGIFLIQRIPLPQERIHLLEYTILGGLTLKDFLKAKNRKVIYNIIFALVFVFLISLIDEGFQKLLPYRVWDIRDIGFNICGGISGIIILFICKK